MPSEGIAVNFVELEVTWILMLGRYAWMPTELLTSLT